MDRKADTAMHRFISLISHKLRTPLVTIRAYPRLLLSENTISPLNDFQKNALLTIQKQCRLMEDMVNQLIAFSQPRSRGTALPAHELRGTYDARP